MDRFDLWTGGQLRGANAFPRHTVEDLRTLRSWGANLVSFGVESVCEFAAPFALKPEAFADIDTALSTRGRGRPLRHHQLPLRAGTPGLQHRSQHVARLRLSRRLRADVAGDGAAPARSADRGL